MSLSIDFDSINNCGSSTSSSSDDCVTSLWHNRLGHALISILSRVGSLHNIKIKDHQCSVCLIAKQTTLPFSESTLIFVCPFDIIYAEYMGGTRVATHDDKRYFLTLVNDFSSYT